MPEEKQDFIYDSDKENKEQELNDQGENEKKLRKVKMNKKILKKREEGLKIRTRESTRFSNNNQFIIPDKEDSANNV